jgi:hypothetical protein
MISMSYPIRGLDKSLGLQEVEAPRISGQSAYESNKVVIPTHRPPLSPRIYAWYSFLLEAKSTPGTVYLRYNNYLKQI